jgi:isomerase DpgB
MVTGDAKLRADDGAPGAARLEEATIDPATDLVTITQLVNDLCARAEGHGDGTIAIARLASAAPPTAWPGDVAIHAINKWERAVRRFEGLAGTTVVTASGTCGGCALDLLLAADCRLATHNLALVAAGHDRVACAVSARAPARRRWGASNDPLAEHADRRTRAGARHRRRGRR